MSWPTVHLCLLHCRRTGRRRVGQSARETNRAPPPWERRTHAARRLLPLRGRPRAAFLVSPDATFSCGFLEAGNNAFSFSVWYSDAANKTAVWTANPDAPVNGRGSRISFRHDGSLALSGANGIGTTVWESKTSGAGLSVSLLDTGNLVISDDPSSSGGGRTLWQSFDWPVDTLVPSQRLTKDTTLVSRYFILYYDNDNVLRLRYDGPDASSIYWPNTDYAVFPNGRTSYNSSRVAVLDDAGVFLSSDNLQVVASDLGVPGIKRRLTIDPDGDLRIYSLESGPIDGGCLCAPGHQMVDQHDWRQGCKPMFSVTTNCSQAALPEQRFKFVEVPHTDFYGHDMAYNNSVTFEYCKKLCLEMCSCAAFSYRPFEGHGKCYRKGSLFSGYTSPDFIGNIYLKVPIGFDPSARSVSARSSQGLACDPDGPEIVQGTPDTFQWSYLFAFAGVLGVLDLIFIATGWWFLSSKQSIPSSLEEAGYRMVRGQFRRFTYRELKDATGNFKEELGRGGSGVVYRGVLDKGKVVAVKKLTNVAGGDDEFWAEMTLIGRINHINLVRTWGFCSQGKHKLLVYEYMENESLDRHLFGTADRTLPWRERYRIALGTARGLAYLHHECLEWVIHCDVKPENILLTREFDAKIADFGLAKL
ncbi:putative receptor protein kinase ZmPK1 [Zea mays]|uniref:non-specific serine/threonine protein kinase n=1 Tax=Zea mays TaxID=4577 RepID=A0A3L6DRV9_MAIZE|nr:putative receptor protein kinase ZmPK1 [Zea mays]